MSRTTSPNPLVLSLSKQTRRPTTQTPLVLSLSKHARTKLTDRAA
ncbi:MULTISPECIES: hypothetical protein [unclassified Novosphingobium]|nr:MULTISPECIES: hypothetical protein [unclassified Novosphingobium]